MIFSEHMFIRVQPSLRDDARDAAERAGLTVAELVRRALQREIHDPAAAYRPSSTDPVQGERCPISFPPQSEAA